MWIKIEDYELKRVFIDCISIDLRFCVLCKTVMFTIVYRFYRGFIYNHRAEEDEYQDKFATHTNCTAKNIL